MPERKINLEEILYMYLDWSSKTGIVTGCQIYEIKDAMKVAIKQVLELAAENAKIAPFIIDGHVIYPDARIDKQSILNTINQIE